MNDRAQYPFEREPGVQDPSSEVDVDLGAPMDPTTLDGATIRPFANGDVEVDFGGENDGALPSPEQSAFYDNLARYLTETDLDRIGMDVCEAVDVDLESRREWLQRFQKGMELLGVIEPSANLGVLKHAKEVTHPVIATALIQYQARAIAEAFPPEGPVKTMVMGEKSPDREAQADRVAGFMNYQLLVEDRAHFPEADQGFLLQGLEGSIFKKVYRDELMKQNVSRLVMARDFIVPYGATSLETAPRYTHILPYSQNDVRKLQVGGFYRDCDLDIPTGEAPEGQQAARQAQDKLEGQERSDQIEDDRQHLIYEQHTELDLPGFEHTDAEGEPTEVKLPYVVHVDRDTQRVLAIYRNWRPHDPAKKKRVRFTHYKFLPGPGFYGLGLAHVIGGLGAAATGILRLLMVTAAFAGAGGGFKTKEGGKINGSVELEPGVFKDVEASYEELEKSFYQPTFHQPPEALFKVLGLVIEGAKEFSGSTEAMTGEGPATGPVGTMVALIEQGSKVYSGIHKRNHMAAGEEYRQLAELNGEHLPYEDEGGYPYDVPGESREVFAEDFDDRVDVLPVSDPNIFSSTQRIALAQTGYQLAKENPGEVNLTEAIRRLFSALRMPDVDAMLIRRDVPRADAVSENAMCIVGKAVRAYPDQDHDAHNAVHAAVMNDKNLPDPAKQAMAGHIAEHMALKWISDASQAIGITPLPMNLGAEPGQPVAPQLSPENERLLTQRAAAVVNKLRPPPQDPEMAQVEGDLKIKKARSEGELKIMAWRAQGEMKLKAAQAKWGAAIDRQTAHRKLAQDRQSGIEQMRQKGELDKAQMEQDKLNGEGAAHDSAVQTTTAELEAAIKALAEGMQSLGDMVTHALGGTGGASGDQPATRH